MNAGRQPHAELSRSGGLPSGGTPRRSVRSLVLLYLLALLVNGLVAWLVAQPGYTDAYYYFNGGRFIAEGRGLLDPYLWNYVAAPPDLPVPAFAYWQPMPSFLAALGILLFGRSSPFDAAQMVFVLLGAALAPLTYVIAFSSSGERRHALLAGLLAVFSGFYAIYWSLPESFTPFALSGAGALALAGLGRRAPRWWVWLLAGVCAGLGHLTRADGVLLLAVVGFVALLPREGSDKAGRLGGAVLAAIGYLLVMAPWFARNLAAFGRILPSGGINALWLIEYNDLFNYPPDLSPARYFAAGWGTILSGKWAALRGNLASFVGVNNLVFLVPFTLIGLWRRWRESWLLPAALYGVALFAAMTFAFSWPGVRGGWFHSSGALMPFIFSVALVGLDDVLRWVSRRRRTWDFETARRVFGASVVVLAGIVTGFAVLMRVVGLPDLRQVAWNGQGAVYDEIGVMLDALCSVPPDVRVMSNDPPGFYTHTGRGGVPLPNGDEATLLRAADDYRVSFVVVDRNVADPLIGLYLNGPESGRLLLIGTFGSPDDPVYLYRLLEEPVR